MSDTPDSSGEVEVDEHTIYNLATQVAEDRYLVGYMAIIKTIDESGNLLSQFVVHEMNNYEIVGILQAHLDRLRQENAFSLYSEDDEDDEEE